MLGEETGEDGGCKSTRCGEGEEVERRDTVSAGGIGESGKVRKEIFSTKKVEKMGVDRRDETHQKSRLERYASDD